MHLEMNVKLSFCNYNILFQPKVDASLLLAVQTYGAILPSRNY